MVIRACLVCDPCTSMSLATPQGTQAQELDMSITDIRSDAAIEISRARAPNMKLNIEAARAELVDRGADAGEVFHRWVGAAPSSGVNPERRSYASYATLMDPDGNEWLLQEVTMRLPGRVDADHTILAWPTKYAGALRRAAAAHGQHEKWIS